MESYITLDGELEHWMGRYSTVDGELQPSEWGVTAQWMGNYITVDRGVTAQNGELQHSGWGSYSKGWGVTAQCMEELQHRMGSYSTVDGELQHRMVSYSTADGELQHTGWVKYVLVLLTGVQETLLTK